MQETNSRQTLCSQLKTVDASLLFLLFIILSVVLSYAAVGIQRRQLADTLAGNTQAAAALPPVFPIRCCASALVIGALGFFLCLALNAWQQASQGWSWRPPCCGWTICSFCSDASPLWKRAATCPFKRCKRGTGNPVPLVS